MTGDRDFAYAVRPAQLLDRHAAHEGEVHSSNRLSRNASTDWVTTNRPARRIPTVSATASTSDKVCDERKTVPPGSASREPGQGTHVA